MTDKGAVGAFSWRTSQIGRLTGRGFAASARKRRIAMEASAATRRTSRVIRETDNGDGVAGAERVSFVPTPIADPGPLGLAAFALTTFVLSMVNAGLISDKAEPVVFGLALAYGGLAQMLAGMWEFRTGNTFGAVAFTSYGAFWLSFWAFVQFYAPKVPTAETGHAVGLFLIAWGIFTAYMFIASLRTTAAIALVFVLLAATFFVLGFGEINGTAGIIKLGGWLGLAAAAAAWYASFAGVTNATFGRVVMPVRPLRR
jgi:succinate-acetate transporter protein